MTTILGDGLVRVKPDWSTFDRDLDRGVSAAADGAGKNSGGVYGESFSRSSSSRITSGLKRVAIAAAGLFASREIIGGANAMVQRASDLNETTTKTDVIFGKASKNVKVFAKGALEGFAQTEQSALNAAATFGTFGKAAGLSDRENAKFSKGLTQLATDMASFSNTTPEEAIEALGSGLRGEAEPLRQYGVLLDDATLRNRALKLGLIETTSQALTPQQKVLASHAEIMRQTRDAQGDYARTSGGLANQQRKLSAQSETLKTTIGRGLLPVYTSVTRLLTSRFMPATIDLAEKWVPKLSARLSEWITSGNPNEMLAGLGDKLRGIDWASVSSGATEVGSSLREILAAVGKGGVETITSGFKVFGIVLGFLADHADLLAQAMPYLAAGFMLVKTAQLAANVAAALAVPTKIAEVVVNRQLVASNKALVASRTQVIASTVAETTTTTANTAANSTGLLTRLRATAATIAHSVAAKAAAAATAVMTGAQWLLNAAMSANPIGLIVLAIAALVVGLIVAYKKSETFRDIVNKAFTMVKNVVASVIGWFRTWVPAVFAFVVGAVRRYVQAYRTVVTTAFNIVRRIVTTAIDVVKRVVTTAFAFIVAVVKRYISIYRTVITTAFNIVRTVITRAMNAVRTVVGGVWGAVTGIISRGATTIVNGIKAIPGKILALKSKFLQAGKDLIGAMVNGLKNAGGIISGIAGNVWSAVKSLLNGAIDKLNNAFEFTIDLPGPKNLSVNLPNIPHLATGGRVDGRAATPVVIGDGFEPESVLPDSLMVKALERAARAGSRLGPAGSQVFQVYETLNARATAREIARIQAFAGAS